MHELAYDENIWAVYVVENGNSMMYILTMAQEGHNGDNTRIEDLDGKSDEEIIEFIEEKKRSY